jgi:hypothetical protein
MSTILLIVLILLLIGALPTWPYSSGWGFYPSGGLGLVLLILLILVLTGRLWPLWHVNSTAEGGGVSELLRFCLGRPWRGEPDCVEGGRGLPCERGAWARGPGFRLRGAIALASHPPDQERAEAHYRQAHMLATELGMRPLVAHCHLGLATLYRRTGERAKANEHLSTATTMYARWV